MRRKARLGTAFGLTTLSLTTLCGCGLDPRRNPQADVGEPAVFTALHLQAAQVSSDAADQRAGAIAAGSVRDDMLRYFRSKDSDYDTLKLRGDAMLDSQQQAESVAQIAATSLTIKAQLTATKLGTKPPKKDDSDPKSDGGKAADSSGDSAAATPKEPVADTKTGKGGASDSGDAGSSGDQNKKDNAQPATQPSTLPALTEADKAALAKALTAVVQDSPFDRIERVYNFYSLLHLKLLLGYGHDSRVLDPQVTYLAWRRFAQDRASAAAGMATALKAQADRLQSDIAAAIAADTPDHPVADGVIDSLSTRTATLTKSKVALSNLVAVTQDTPIRADPFAYVLRFTEQPAQGAEKQAAEKQAAHVRRVQQLAALAGKVADLQTSAEQDVQATAKALTDAAAAAANAGRESAVDSRPIDDQPDRLLYLVFPVSITPGARSNYAVGARIRITGATLACQAQLPDRWKYVQQHQGEAGLVKIVSVQPTRTYDLKTDTFIDLARNALSTAFSADIGTDSPASPNAKIDADFERQQELQARRNFLTRMSKEGAFLDAQNHEFGWNFNPSNIQLFRNHLLTRIFSGYEYQVSATLDGGVYDCGAFIVVPRDLTSFTFTADYIYTNIDNDGSGGPEHRVHKQPGNVFQKIEGEDLPNEQRGHVVVTLPKFSPLEWAVQMPASVAGDPIRR